MDTNLQLVLILVNNLIDLMRRAQSGANVSADLLELKSKVLTLLEQEQAIAKGDN